MQPRSYDWEADGPPTSNPAFADTPAGAYAATLNGQVGGGPEAAIHMLRALGDWDIRTRYPELNRQTIPTLVIVGGHEPQKTVELSYEWHQQINGSDFVILPDAYHGAARENPIAWNAAVHDFLRRNGL
jgi:pimeloyl-ACP methyl ester carboxylesterase